MAEAFPRPSFNQIICRRQCFFASFFARKKACSLYPGTISHKLIKRSIYLCKFTHKSAYLHAFCAQIYIFCYTIASYLHTKHISLQINHIHSQIFQTDRHILQRSIHILCILVHNSLQIWCTFHIQRKICRHIYNFTHIYPQFVLGCGISSTNY